MRDPILTITNGGIGWVGGKYCTVREGWAARHSRTPALSTAGGEVIYEASRTFCNPNRQLVQPPITRNVNHLAVGDGPIRPPPPPVLGPVKDPWREGARRGTDLAAQPIFQKPPHRALPPII